MAAILLSLREGLEVALIVGVLLGALRKLDQYHLARYVWAGIACALLVSLSLAVALTSAGISFDGVTEELYEGVTLLLAAAVLTGMMFWMRAQGARLRRTLEVGVKEATARSGGGDGAGRISLFSVAFLAVVREGLELSLLLAAAGFSTSLPSLLMGAAFGLGAAATIGWLFFAGVIHLDLKRFFGVTNILLTLFAAGMIALGVHELVEAGLVPAIVAPVWNTNWLLDESSSMGQVLKTLLGYNGNPTLVEVLAYAAYLLVVTVSMRRRPEHSPAAAPV